jgi:hypothetical protein
MPKLMPGVPLTIMTLLSWTLTVYREFPIRVARNNFQVERIMDFGGPLKRRVVASSTTKSDFRSGKKKFLTKVRSLGYLIANALQLQ